MRKGKGVVGKRGDGKKRKKKGSDQEKGGLSLKTTKKNKKEKFFNATAIHSPK